MERLVESILFGSRWLLVPFYLGLVVSLALLMVKFLEELVHLFPQVLHMTEGNMILAILGLIDLSLTANLLILMILSGYESFVSRMEAHVDRPDWMGKVDFSGLKLKLVGSVVAISAIQLLRAFMNIGQTPERDLMWLVIVHLTFVVSGVLLALMDRLTASAHQIEVATGPDHGTHPGGRP